MIPDLGLPSSSINGLAGFDEKNPKAIAAKVQAMFTDVMIKAMEDSIGAEDGLFGGSSTSDIYRGMFRDQLSASIGSQLGGGLLEQIENGLLKSDKKSEKDHDHEDEGADSPVSALPVADLSGLPVHGRVTSEVGWRQDPINGVKRFHKGTDIAAAAGTPIQAVASGRVVESGAKGTYGNAVVIETDDGRRMLYAHNQQNFVRVGERVVRGDAIAAVGATGRATGPHVHFEVSDR